MQTDSRSENQSTDPLERSRSLAERAWENRNDDRALCRQHALEALTLAGDDPLARAFALRSLAYVDCLESKFVPALEAAQTALQIASQHGHLLLQRDLLNTFGAIHYRLGELDSALDLLHKC